MTEYVPVFDKEGNKVVFAYSGWVGKTEDEAWKIGVGSIVEQVQYGVRFDKVLAIVDKQLEHFETKLGPATVFLIEGPEFNKLKEDEQIIPEAL